MRNSNNQITKQLFDILTTVRLETGKIKKSDKGKLFANLNLYVVFADDDKDEVAGVIVETDYCGHWHDGPVEYQWFDHDRKDEQSAVTVAKREMECISVEILTANNCAAIED